MYNNNIRAIKLENAVMWTRNLRSSHFRYVISGQCMQRIIDIHSDIHAGIQLYKNLTSLLVLQLDLKTYPSDMTLMFLFLAHHIFRFKPMQLYTSSL